MTGYADNGSRIQCGFSKKKRGMGSSVVKNCHTTDNVRLKVVVALVKMNDTFVPDSYWI
jgi:hypothetical protein